MLQAFQAVLNSENGLTNMCNCIAVRTAGQDMVEGPLSQRLELLDHQDCKYCVVV